MDPRVPPGITQLLLPGGRLSPRTRLNKPLSSSGALRSGSGRPEPRREAAPTPDAAPPSRGGDRRAVARARQSLSPDRFDLKRRRGWDSCEQVQMAQNALDHRRLFH